MLGILSHGQRVPFILWCCVVSLFAASCSRPPYMTSNQYLLMENKIAFEKQKYKLQEDQDNIYYELEPILNQKPNLIVLGTRPRLFFYRAFYHADSTKPVRRWLRNKLGEKPAILDSALCVKTTNSMRYFLNHKGYYNAKTSFEIRYRRHKAFVTYRVQPNERLLIDTIAYESADSALLQILNKERKNSYITKGDPVDRTLLEKERARLTIAIRNHGYEKFTWNYIALEADTVNARKYTPDSTHNLFKSKEQGEPRAAVYINILPFSDTSATHPKYTINQVFVIPEDVTLKPHQTRFIKRDTAFIVLDKKGDVMVYASDSLVPDSARVVQYILRRKGSKPIMRNKLLAQAIPIYSDTTYNYDKTRETVRQLTELDVFKFPHVEFTPSPTNPNALDCWIRMKSAKKQVLNTDVEVNTYNANLGSALNVSYRNRNIFRGAEVFSLSTQLGGVLRLRPDSTQTLSNSSWLNRFVYLLDINSEASLYIPRFVAPRWVSRRMESPKTRVSLGYRYLQQGADLRIGSITARLLSYEWKLKRNVRHQFVWNPFLLNIILQADLSEAYYQRLLYNNPALLASLTDKLVIPSMEFSYTYNTPDRKASNSWYFKFYSEVAGNAIHAVDKIVKPDTAFKFGSLDYAQYAKADIDLRYSFYLNRKNSIVTRMMLGAALPYGNSAERGMPYSRRFFLGGPSSMRAWLLRQIGPGRVKGDERIPFQLGDIRLELNAEWRFKFNSWIAGALFLDMGNVWLWKPTELGAIQPPVATPITGVISKDFWRELAIGTGFGLRFDFTFFVLRLDYGVQVYNPAGYGFTDTGNIKYWNLPPTLNWNTPFKLISNSNLVLAVGYPF